MIKNKFVVVLAVLIVAMGAVGIYNSVRVGSEDGSGKTAVLYKSPSCGCCTQYTSYLKSRGYKVKVVKTNNMDDIKNQYNIPYDMESCHTTIIDGYVVEGHIPIEGIDYLLENKPDIDGIALPGMPIGSPGMLGLKTEPFEIFSLKGGIASKFINL